MKKEKTKRLNPSDIDVTFLCPKCDKITKQALNEAYFSASEADCEMCGSHGNIKAEFTCSHCKHIVEIDLRDW